MFEELPETVLELPFVDHDDLAVAAEETVMDHPALTGVPDDALIFSSFPVPVVRLFAAAGYCGSATKTSSLRQSLR
jgi:hypothetical protein